MAVALATSGLGGLGVRPAQAVTGGSDWPQFRAGPAHPGSDVASTITPANVSTLTRAWQSPIGGVASSPAVVGGVAYAGSADHNLYAVPAGEECSGMPCPPLWSAPTAGAVESSPAVAGGVVYVGSLDHALYAFDAAGSQGCSGTPKVCAPLWTAATGDAISSSPAVAGGRVYVGSNDDKLYAFDAAGVTNCGGTPRACAPLWTGATGGDVFSSPAVSAGVVYVGSDDGRLYAFDAAGATNCAGTPRTCAPLWSATTGAAVGSSPTVVNGVVHVGSSDGKLYAFDAAGATNCSGTPKTCAPLWTTATGALISSPAVADGVVYVGSLDQKLYAVDAAGVANCGGVPRTCTPLWTAVVSTEPANPVISSPAVANGLVFVGAGSGAHQIHAFDAKGTTNCSGAPAACAPVWTGETDTGVRTSPAVAGDKLYLGRDGLGLLAFELGGAGQFHPLPPARILDTRSSVAIGPNGTLSLPVTGRGGIPADDVSSVVLNVAVTQPTADGYLTVFPSGAGRPLASSINFAPGQTRSNSVVVKVGAGGAVDIYNAQGGTHVVVDVGGWFGLDGASAGARYNPMSPARILDTRDTAPAGPNSTLSLMVAGRGGLPPAGVSAVVVNLAVTQPTADGFLTVFPSGTARPLASSINFAPGTTVSNSVVAKLGPDGKVAIYNAQGSTHVVVDIQGWFGPEGGADGARFNPVVPTRIVDTRDTAAIGPNGTLSLLMTGRAGIPAGAAAVVLNVAVTQPTAAGFLTVYPAGVARPLASNINFPPGQTVSNLVVAKVGVDGRVEIYNAQGSTHVVVDVEGWFAL